MSNIKMSKQEAINFFSELFLGQHEYFGDTIPYQDGWMVMSQINFTTYDKNYLTRLVVLAHDKSINAEIKSFGRKTCIVIYKRNDKSINNAIGHYPTIEQIIAEIRENPHQNPNKWIWLLPTNMLALKIPDDANIFTIFPGEFQQRLIYNTNNKKYIDCKGYLPHGLWAIAGIAENAIPGFNCDAYVGNISADILGGPLYVDYANMNSFFDNSQESFSSLLHSCGCSFGRYLILLNKNQQS